MKAQRTTTRTPLNDSKCATIVTPAVDIATGTHSDVKGFLWASNQAEVLSFTTNRYLVALLLTPNREASASPPAKLCRRAPSISLPWKVIVHRFLLPVTLTDNILD